MNALSRREEETLQKTTKARALRECDSVVKGLIYLPLVLSTLTSCLEFADCATGRTVSVAWACRDHLKRVQECMIQ